ncbi:VanZ family protein [Arthrobacter burdickii]|uniref:VanZ family protein n=1 Tax=Arthrobacter burdickii TaxID=3035920 RepID=A0ABT8K7U8_9MICC|nr:VanZ family protein [Arthrobacter burdickii]MDN4612587.1 VanZ family protein [Arthrobacter burdickii]
MPSRRYKTVTASLCAAWVVAVAFIVLWPTPVDHDAAGILRRGLGFLHQHGFPSFITYNVVEFTSNVLMFVPFGLFWFILAPYRWRWWGVAAGCALSVLIEATQLVLLPQRFATPYDVLANTIGALTGAALGWAHLQLRGRHRAR